MRQDPASSTSEMYELKIVMFKIGKPEELLQTTKNFRTAIDGTGNTTAARKIKYLHNILRGESL